MTYLNKLCLNEMIGYLNHLYQFKYHKYKKVDIDTANYLGNINYKIIL